MTSFYIIEATVWRGFLDPVGPADQGWSAQPWSALCQIETGVSATQSFTASDVGYRSKSTDSIGVVSYPPRVMSAFSVDVAVNLDPTQSNVGASWGTLQLANTDNTYDSLIAGWSSEGQAIVIKRGTKVYDPIRGYFTDPAYASLTSVFAGIMGPWRVGQNTVEIDLHDATYFLSSLYPRTLYGGTGGADGTAALAGVQQPVAIGQGLNVTPQPVDPANLIYQIGGVGVRATAVYDGGVALTLDTVVTSVFTTAAPAAGFYRYDTNGFIRLGSSPTFGLTVDFTSAIALLAFQMLNMSYRILTLDDMLNVPAQYVSSDGDPFLVGDGLLISCVDRSLLGEVVNHRLGYFMSASDQMTGIQLMSAYLSPSGTTLVCGRDGALRFFCLFSIPSSAVTARTLTNANIISVTPIPLPASVDPPPIRMRLAYSRNWTIQSGSALAGAITPDRLARVSVASQVATGVAPAPMLSLARTDPPVIGQNGGSCDVGAPSVQANVNDLIAVWGVKRKLYEVVIPAEVMFASPQLDWASVVSLTTDFDGLDAGKRGQVVGWRFASGDPTATIRVFV